MEHLVVTPPDRYYGEGYKVLWIDWNWPQIEQCVASLAATPRKLVISVFGPNDTDMEWLINSANQADLIIMNIGAHTPADPIKGHLIAYDKTYYYGRKDLSKLFNGYIDDPLGSMLSFANNLAEEEKE